MKERKEMIMQVIFGLSACVCVLAVALICVFLFANGIPGMAKIGVWDFLTGTTWKPGNNKFGILPMILGSIYVTGGAIILGVPVGLFTAVFMAKYCPKKVYRWVKPLVELLAGIPSIIYGFFGMVVLVPFIREVFGGKGQSMLAASIVLGIMILPTIINVSESAIRAVPGSYYEGALALGADKERSIFFAVLPAAEVRYFGRSCAGRWQSHRRDHGGNHDRRQPAENAGQHIKRGTYPYRQYCYGDGVRHGSAPGGADCHCSSTVCLYFIDQSAFICAEKEGGRMKPKQKKVIHPVSVLLKILVWFSAAVTIGVSLFLICYILIKGIPHLSPELFAWKYTSDNVSMMPAVINTLIVVGITLLLAVPLGIFAAIYLVEYAKRGSRLVKLIRITAETLSGIPSIVYGLFGMLFFVTYLHWNYSILAGAFTLAIMILPTIMRTTEEALLAVPDSYREGSFGLGAGKLRTVFRIVLPTAIPGIMAGVILAIGRIVGETAALIYTAGTVAEIPKNLLSSGRTLSVHMYQLSNEGLHVDQTYATAVILLLTVILINWASGAITRHFTAKASPQ